MRENIDEFPEELIQEYPEEIEKLEKTYDTSPEALKTVITIEELKKECEGNEILEKILEDTINSFYRYAETICQYERILSGDLTDEKINEEFQKIDKKRSIVHNALIDNLNILARTLNKFGKNADWIEKLGPKTNRAAYAKLALQNTYLQLMKYKNKKEKKENEKE